ncbi:AMP-dependent synthetase and ligase [Anaeromyxobacter dehalogenans 2CP-1]|uniref:AMP-dependent synthetase and ligase n=1 Tax=Anaeromyxobacter dehalogenans (strain ATCC BAA-258 / DSM 21875 / 2CP-1) TaxID=455488 RepID=B8JGQ7_ANAD2|nr:AMP-binding protein [Anaeromyxobacter dehalogenans]ACL66544.1 AMP-dependent synthetase and ligase [Anaeromyxobacter dehalogenans 2CP-1]
MNAPSYVSGPSTTPLLGETIGENLRRTVQRFPDRDALVSVYQGYRATYRQFWEETSLVARGLLVRGVKKGDRVGIWAPNRYEWVVIQYASARIGAILVNINPAYRVHELEYALKQSGVSTLLLARTFRNADYVAMVRDVRLRCPELRQTIVIDDEWGALKHDALRFSEDELARLERDLQFDDPINIQYTSGTTGFPKGATLSHHNIVNNGFFIGEFLRYTDADRVCIPVPFYHCFGMVLANMAITTHGAAMVIPLDNFDPLTVMRTVQQERCTALYGVPTMFIAELDHPEFQAFDFSSLRTGIMAGSPCPVEVMKKVQKDMHMPEVTICYGMTETSPVSTQSRTDDPLEKRVTTVGQVHPHVEIKIVDPTTGRIVPRGTPGELCTRGYSVMLGYWRDPHATREAIDDGRWMHTGDLATIDEHGYVKIVGRIKDMVLRGGENIFPREVEEFLYTIPGVSDVQVIGVPDVKYGEELMAWVKLRPGVTLTGEEVRAYCKGKIATYKIPRYYKFVDGFPMTVSGKVQKYKMRETAIQELGLQQAASIETA